MHRTDVYFAFFFSFTLTEFILIMLVATVTEPYCQNRCICSSTIIEKKVGSAKNCSKDKE